MVSPASENPTKLHGTKQNVSIDIHQLNFVSAEIQINKFTVLNVIGIYFFWLHKYPINTLTAVDFCEKYKIGFAYDLTLRTLKFFSLALCFFKASQR